MSSSSIVHLNVGGKKFATTIGTLTKDSESMLAKMVDEYWDLKKVKAGQALFIDRDPSVFDYILNYLRDDLSHVILPAELEQLRRLKAEADFYQLNELKRSLNRKIKDIESDFKQNCVDT
uniref:BTB domain-containing protein n=1 Tax=Romanomermis culicivorax TaxID=13658 RepID=A0A915KCX1_ROMCU